MKISITQIILGICILIAMALSVALDSYGFYIREFWEEPGYRGAVFNPNMKEVIATALSYFVLLMATSVIGISIALLITKVRQGHLESDNAVNVRARRLIITQIILGVLITVSAFLVMIWGFPTSYSYHLSNEVMKSMFFMPGRQFMWAQGLSFLTSILGLILLGCSMRQVISMRTIKINTMRN
jgi:glucan phosphoethanolaminetransferase (alkaline phosphatase superfamily)